MEDREKILTVISLGVGVQSSAMALMAAKGELPMPDCAVFADTGAEPDSIYSYLEFLKSELPFPIYVVQKGNLTEDTMKEGERFAPAPFFIKNLDGSKGMLRRQCTNEYKIQPVRRKVRELCGVGFGKRFPKGKYVEQWIGISTDEIQRMKPSRDKYIENRHPLIELNISRQQCLQWFKDNNYPLPEKSACFFCPYKSDDHWIETRDRTPKEFEQAIAFDKGLRSTSNTRIKGEMFLHRSCTPLDQVEFKSKKVDNQMDLFDNECEGMCGL